jgi:hypothetical protein
VELSSDLLATMSGLSRPAWVPIAEKRDDLGGASKFAGTPLLHPGETWPQCAMCRKPLALFLQLNLATLPEDIRGEFGHGHLQMFYCVSDSGCCVQGENWHSPFAPHQLLRRIDSSRSEPAVLAPRFDRILPASTIVGWERIDDYPNSYELDELGVELDDEIRDELFERGLTAAQRDKLLGWPAWVQNANYPECRICGRALWLIFSLESHQNLWYAFGDSGSGQLTGCPDHPDELAFAWQCL